MGTVALLKTIRLGEPDGSSVSIPGLARAMSAFLSCAGVRVPLLFGGMGRAVSSTSGETSDGVLEPAGAGRIAWTSLGRSEYARS